MTKKTYKFASVRPSFVDQKDFDYVDLWGDKVATFTLRYMDMSNPVISSIMEAAKRKNATNGQLASTDGIKRAFVEACILGWDMQIDGEAVPFSVDTALDYFAVEGNDIVLGTLMTFCNDGSNFLQPKTIAKN